MKHAHNTNKPNPDQLIRTVQKLSKARGERMTDVRRDVIAVMSRLKKPYGAYRILAELNKKRMPKLSAMSLYRTLDFLIDLGVVLKLESQNAYRLCDAAGHDHSHLLMVCDDCGNLKEISDGGAAKKIQALARQFGHKLNHQVVELHGSCVKCAD